MQHGLSHAPPGRAQATTNYKLLYGSYKVEATVDLGLQRIPFQEAPVLGLLVAGFKSQQKTTQLAKQVEHPRGGHSRHQSTLERILLCRVRVHAATCLLWYVQMRWPVILRVILAMDWPTANKFQLQ